MPEISVLVTCLNESREVLERALLSVFNQTFIDWELILVVDNPHNKQALILVQELTFGEPRFCYLVQSSRKGRSQSLNDGIERCSGRYLAILDADDEAKPNRLEVQYNYLITHQKWDVVGSSLSYVDDKGNLLLERHYPQDIGWMIKRHYPVAHPTLMMKRELFEKYGTYDITSFALWVEDYELLIRWYLQGVKITNITDNLYVYHQNTSNSKNMKTKCQLRNEILIKWHYREHLHLNWLDYAYMLGESSLLLLPAKMIISIFYWYHSKLKS